MGTRVTALALATLVLVTAACPKGAPPTGTVTPVTSPARVYYDDSPAFRDSLRMVVRDVNTWHNVWAQATSTQPTPPALPDIDYSREMVIVVAAGRLTPGDQIHVDSAGVRGGQFVVVVRTTVQCRPFAADAYPFEIVRVARSDKQVTFIEHRDRAPGCQ